MAYIREKRIKGKPYAYLAENTWTAKGPRQKITRYLGPVAVVDEKDTRSFADFLGTPVEKTFETKPFADVANAAIKYALSRFGFNESEGVYRREMLSIASAGWKPERNGKPIILRLGRGHFSPETVQALLDYDGTKDPTGKKLARLLIATGIHPDEELYFELFAKSHQGGEHQETIYY